jgi:hypothetical protein
MIHVQRILSRSQTILSALEGVRPFIQSRGQDSLDRYLHQMQYNREPVLMPLRDQILSIVQQGDTPALESLIQQEMDTIRSVSAELIRFTVAEQNARAVGVEGDTLKEIVAGIKENRDISFNLFRENIINLLS